ncbi:MAG: DNA-3-methyladenine glycosylase 2 [Candidatus Obscuribacterales bacterium]|nr:DNA-3-methyladenine glycosylase 2 [Candidatus Obscuribacterales bacterium]
MSQLHKTLNSDDCYRALIARDSRFDGVFFVAVKSTRIYCRPVCTVKSPMQRNCTFYPSAAICESNGYRPCLRCRPELAPGHAPVDSRTRLAGQALRLIDDLANSDLANSDLGSLAKVAQLLGVTPRHLRRVFEGELGVSPMQYILTQRLLAAKLMLTDTNMPVTEIALASGFASVRRFNDAFVEHYKLNPSRLRKEARPGWRNELKTDARPNIIACQLSYRPPYDWESMLSYLRARGSALVERVSDDGKYLRTVAIGDSKGYLVVEQTRDSKGQIKPNALTLSMSASLGPVFMQVVTRIKRLFDLQANPLVIADALGELAAERPGLRVPGAFDSFEIGVRAILGQQVSVKAATSLAGRLAERFGERIETPYADIYLATPDPQVLASADVDEISALGIMPTRAKAIKVFATAYGELDLAPGADYETTVAALTALPGIGEWTAEYIAMRCLAWPDAFMHGDLGIKKALGISTKKALIEVAQQYKPWRAYATMHLWKSLEIK